MFVGAIKTVTRSIFPIFFELKRDGMTTIGVSGTAFFINDEGYFVTAEHVIADIPSGAKKLYTGNIPDSFLQPIEIEEVYRDAMRDIYIGRVPKQYALPKLNFSDNEAGPGQSLCLCGYPLAQMSLNQNGFIDVSNVRKYWQPTFMVDRIASNINGRMYAGLITQHASLKGMSGGPVFGLDGLVYGIDVAVMGREIPDPATPMIIHNGIVIGLAQIKEVLNKGIQPE